MKIRKPASSERVEGGLRVKSAHKWAGYRGPTGKRHYRLLDSEKHLERTIESVLGLHLAGVPFSRLDRPLAWFTTGGVSFAYYRTRGESYETRWEHGLLSPRRYFYKRLALVFKAPLRGLREAAASRCFNEISELRAACGDLGADSLAMKDEIDMASAHIAMLEREIGKKNALIEHLEERIRNAGGKHPGE